MNDEKNKVTRIKPDRRDDLERVSSDDSPLSVDHPPDSPKVTYERYYERIEERITVGTERPGGLIALCLRGVRWLNRLLKH
ncbi:MAG: hypothetical protein ACYSUV_17975 [Planctomycetota bacterium]|jgi:hypothetical protein